MRAYEQHTRRRSPTRSAPRSRRPCRARTIPRRSRPPTAASRRTVPANKVADLLKVDGVVAVQSDTLEQPQTDGNAGVHRRDRRCGRRSAARTTPARTSSSACSTPASGRSTRRSPTTASRPARRPVRLRSSATAATSRTSARRSRATTSSIGAYAFTQTRTWRRSAPGADEFCNNATRRLLGRATPTATARTPRRRPPATASTTALLFGVDRGPISGMAPGAHVIMYRVCLEQGCFHVRLGGGGRAGDRRRRRRDQLLDLGRRQPVHGRGRARVPRRVQRGHLRQRLGREQPARAPARSTTAGRG